MTIIAEPMGQKRRPRKSTLVKGLIALILLALLAWIWLTFFVYRDTGKPISEISTIPQPVGNLLENQPKYYSSIPGVSRPLGVAVAPNGTVYATESDGERMIRAFDTQGKQTAAFAPPGEPAARNLTYIAVSPAGLVYASDLFAHKIFIFSPSGEPAGEVASPFAEGWLPQGLAFDAAGNLYVTERTPGKHRVVVLDPAGNLIREFGKEGAAAGEFSFPNTLTVDSKGNIYVSDSGNGRVQTFDTTGKPLWMVGRGNARGDLAVPRGIVVDNDRQLLLVVDTTDQGVNVYDISGAAPKFAYGIGAQGTGNDAFSFPNGIAESSQGYLYITDRENNRVAVWRY